MLLRLLTSQVAIVFIMVAVTTQARAELPQLKMTTPLKTTIMFKHFKNRSSSMPLELNENGEAKLLEVKASGKLSKEDYDHFEPTVERDVP